MDSGIEVFPSNKGTTPK
ncbi:hypothetical protein AYI68_g6089, partial [Smittium mucronatum]